MAAVSPNSLIVDSFKLFSKSDFANCARRPALLTLERADLISAFRALVCEPNLN